MIRSSVEIIFKHLRSANAGDCSGMDLEPLDESINQPSNLNSGRLSSQMRLNPLNLKALTSTVSAQRTQSALSGNFKSSKLGEPEPIRIGGK